MSLQLNGGNSISSHKRLNTGNGPVSQYGYDDYTHESCKFRHPSCNYLKAKKIRTASILCSSSGAPCARVVQRWDKGYLELIIRYNAACKRMQMIALINQTRKLSAFDTGVALTPARVRHIANECQVCDRVQRCTK